METAVRTINPHISVDCVIFGFSRDQLKVLLIEREYTRENGMSWKDHKLPGDLITIGEDLDLAAHRTLEELTGLGDIYLRQFAVFGKPERMSRKLDVDWLSNSKGVQIQRVVTSAYFALINIGESKRESAILNRARWIDIDQIPDLAFDHQEIIDAGLEHLRQALRNEPIGFELLPDKFTIRELQRLYEAILNCTLDNRNFRKKILKSKYLVQLDEKQAGVAHKPAYFYRFDRDIYEKHRKEFLGFNF